ncbi:response regulator transcription factor [Treponema sp.]
MKMVRIYAVDDHEMFRKGLLGILSSQADFEIMGEAESVQSLLDSPNSKQTDVLLLDLSIGETLSLDRVPVLLEKYPSLRIIALTMHNKPVLIKNSINVGIHGYVVKQSPPEVLYQALRRVANGRNYLDSELSDSLYLCLRGTVGGESSTKPNYNSLTSREQEIFRLLAEGKQVEQIARQLFISRKTVENHRFRIMQKLELSSFPDLLSYASELGVI